MASLRDGHGRFQAQQEPDTGPYLIEAPTGGDWNAPYSCGVVDLRRPRPDPDREGGKGFIVVFTGTFAECDRWLEAHG